MKRIVPIPNMGKVAFPDSMSDEEVQSATHKLHAQANPIGIEDVLHALVKMEKGPSSAAHQKIAGVAQTLEQTPGLLRLAIAGLKASSGNDAAPIAPAQAQEPQSQGQTEPASASGNPTSGTSQGNTAPPQSAAQ